MAKPGWMGSTGTVDAGDPPEAADERCKCESDLGFDMPINFCPFCGLLAPSTAHSTSIKEGK